MVAWVDFDKLESYKKLSSMTKKVDLTEVMAGEEGAARVAEYCMPMSSGLVYNYAAFGGSLPSESSRRKHSFQRNLPPCTTAK